MSGITRPKVFVTRRSDKVPPKGLELLKPICDLTLWEGEGAIPHSELLKKVPGVDALFCMLPDKINSDVIQAAGS